MKQPSRRAKVELSTRLAALVLLAISLAIPLVIPGRVFGQQVTGDEVRMAVEAATACLRKGQRPDGHWPGYANYPGGATALATLALLNAGVSPESDWMRRAIEATRTIGNQHTYTVSLKIQALAAADPVRYRDEIQAAADWLVRIQLQDGMWGYGQQGGRGDFSNSQFAMLGLHEASRAGIRIPDSVWQRAQLAWVNSQQRAGGWSYVPQAGQSTGSMTAAGVASLYIAGNSLKVARERGFSADGRAPGCGRYAEFQPIARGLTWLAAHFNAQSNPGQGTWYFYYMYGVERVGILSGLRYLGTHDWYREGAARLVGLQHPDGSWTETNAVVDTAFALLFLAKGHRPVLFHKLKWADNDRWNLDRNDLAHLAEFIGSRLGEPVSWEVTPLDAEVEDWLAAPILYFNGHQFPDFDEAQVAKLQRYAVEGGTILAEACCGRQEFRDGFAAFAKKLFPEHELRRLPADHPVFRSVFKLDGSAIELHGIDAGCRSSVLFSPNDLSCLWEQGNVPDKSQQAFELGTNIAAYATGLEPLPDKLDVARLVRRTAEGAQDKTSAPARGAVHVAQLMHNGDWRPNPKAVPNLAEYLHSQMSVDVVPSYEPLRTTDPKLAQHPIVYMTGHFSFELPPEEVAALRRHLERGGFLFANACCGRQACDTSFRKLANQLFPDHPLEPLPADHPIIAGQPGVPVAKVTYRPSMQAENPGLTEVRLEGITLEDRTVVVYSPFGIDCGLDGHACFACRGLAPPDALRVAGNVILYALSY